MLLTTVYFALQFQSFFVFELYDKECVGFDYVEGVNGMGELVELQMFFVQSVDILFNR